MVLMIGKESGGKNIQKSDTTGYYSKRVFADFRYLVLSNLSTGWVTWRYLLYTASFDNLKILVIDKSYAQHYCQLY